MLPGSYISQFMEKLLFILKAASDGWIVKYLGGNYFEFYSTKRKSDPQETAQQFIERYSPIN
jgi:hypothetical protein